MDDAPLLVNIMLLGNGIEACLEKRLLIPALILMYSGIDVMGWLVSDKSDASKKSFIKWANDYLLKDSPLKCSAIDLYAARCALLHTMTGRAKPIPNERPRQICYAFDEAQVQRIQLSIDLGGAKDRFVAVHFKDLWESWRIGVVRFLDDVTRDPKIKRRALEKAQTFYSTLRMEEVEAAIVRLSKKSFGLGKHT